MLYSTQRRCTDLSDYKNSKSFSYYKSGGLQLLCFHNLSGGKYCIFKNKWRQSQRVNDINDKLWIIIEKSGKIRPCHCTCMAAMGPPCNHFAAALYRIEAVVRNGLTKPSSTSTANQWLSNH